MRVSPVFNLQKLAVVLPLSALAACATTPPVGGAPDVEIAPVAGLPAPTSGDFKSIADEGIIRPLDVMQVEVFGVEELSRAVQVDASGSVDYPLVGWIPAAGRRLEEFTLELEARLRGAYVRAPDVTARITERAVRNVTVGGDVAHPGRYAIEGPITLMQAVALGGGMDDDAAREEVLVFREVGEARYIGVYNMQGISRGNYPDPTIYPDDIVMVGDSPGRRRLERVLEIVAAISSPLILLERVTR